MHVFDLNFKLNTCIFNFLFYFEIEFFLGVVSFFHSLLTIIIPLYIHWFMSGIVNLTSRYIHDFDF